MSTCKNLACDCKKIYKLLSALPKLGIVMSEEACNFNGSGPRVLYESPILDLNQQALPRTADVCSTFILINVMNAAIAIRFGMIDIVPPLFFDAASGMGESGSMHALAKGPQRRQIREYDAA